VLSLPGLLDPGPFDRMVLIRDYPVLIGLTLAMFIMAYGFRGPGRINRVEGGLLVLGFVAYQTLLYFSETMSR
jgi:cation:H+ antiporter